MAGVSAAAEDDDDEPVYVENAMNWKGLIRSIDDAASGVNWREAVIRHWVFAPVESSFGLAWYAALIAAIVGCLNIFDLCVDS